MWRDKFAKLNHKLDQDQSELDILQRELGVLSTQYYGGDPMKGMQQGMSQADITAKRDKIDAKKKDVADDQQAIADAEVRPAKGGRRSRLGALDRNGESFDFGDSRCVVRRAARAPKTASILPAASKSATPFSPEPILLVEDRAELRAMLRKALERAGYSVDEASDGNIAD